MSLLANMFVFFVTLLFVSASANEVKEKPLSEYINRFTLLAGDALLQSSNGSNVIFSPLNIFHAFSLFHLGSVQKTKEELSSIFGFPENDTKDHHEQFNQTLHSLQALKDVTVAAAVGIFARNDLKFNPSFVEQAKSIYGANIQNVNFSNKSTNQYINSWISQRTKDHMKDYFKNPIYPETEVQLISALYFATNWKAGFGKTNTQKEDFHTGYSTMKVDMMSELSRMEYADDPKYPFRILGLPYKNEDLYFYIQLPREDPTSPKFALNFSAVYLTSLEALESLKPNLVHVKLPRFSITSKMNLQKVLKKFGSTRILEEPQLNRMFEGQEGKVHKMEVDHGVYIDVDETGTESSAVSSISLVPLSASIPEIPVEFFVTKPFTFFTYSKSLKTILFTGAISRVE